MRLLLVVLASCGGVSSDPQASFDDVLADFATARCDWNRMCDARNDGTCPATTIEIENEPTTIFLDGEAACTGCLAAWIDVYTADLASPPTTCNPVLTQAQYDAVHAACETATVHDNFARCGDHDLPGSDPRDGD